jgi:hypothetical protein
VEPLLRKPETTGIRCALAGRIPYQTRAWFNCPWRLGLQAWSAVAACLLVVPAGAELGEPGRGIRLRGTRLIAWLPRGGLTGGQLPTTMRSGDGLAVCLADAPG